MHTIVLADDAVSYLIYFYKLLKILEECKSALSEFKWIRGVHYETAENASINLNGSLSKVKNIIGVSSCKGMTKTFNVIYIIELFNFYI